MYFATNVASYYAGVAMVERFFVTIFVWVAVFVCWHRAIEEVRRGASPLRHMIIGLVALGAVLVVAVARDYRDGTMLCISGAAILAVALQLWIAFLIGVKASEENNIN